MIDLSQSEIDAIVLSLKIAAWSVAGGLPLALAAAYGLARWSFPGKILLDGAVHLPLVLPPSAVGFLLLYLFGRAGPIGAPLAEQFGVTLPFTWAGAALASAVMAFPLMVRAIRLSIEAVDVGLEDAARTLGAGRLDVLATVTLPIALPGLLAAVVLGFARSLGEFGATITFAANIPGETRTIPLALYSATQTPGGEPLALRLAVVSILLAFAALGASQWLASRAVRGR